ncbi:hypothetical protein ONS95_014506 [Cadophora gregata]|uniref:uncharacterized protein n=1 Tax=Cadophora gregata TaxID=51156 RepID=UPI0026DDB571|nr:uncharacterized protein ONS95_014506 [Cadophora gregata]KAK0112772.1 hypothetical protein ONS95_014506 [Cadophora gregata]KAK0124904.1 hypothetical protein ONS96_008782 [Cadophora gregata f. sp. sojae]
MTTETSPQQKRTSPRTVRKERLLPALEQDLSDYTPQRHFKKLPGRVFQRQVVKSSRVESWRNEVSKKDNFTPQDEVARNIETADEPCAECLASEAVVLRNGGMRETVTGLPVRNAAVETSNTTPVAAKPKIKAAEKTPRQPLSVIFRNGHRGVPRRSLPVSQIRDVASTAAQWRVRPTQELDDPVPPPPAPVFPKPKPKTQAVKTYKTKFRSTLPKQSQESNVIDHDAEEDGHVVFPESKPTKIGCDLEPATSSFQYPEDSSPLVVSQESRSLEEYLRGGQRATQDLGKCHSNEPHEAEGSHSDEQLIDELRQEQDENEPEEQENDNEEMQNLTLKEEALSDMEILLLEMVDGCDNSYSPSTSSSPKRPRSEGSSEEGGGSQENEGNGNGLEDADQQKLHVKRRRTERRVPSAEVRKAALRDLSDRRVSKASRQTRDIGPDVTTRPKKSKKSSQSKKRTKEPRRLPDRGELMTAPERLEELEVESAPTPPLELSQDPISQTSDGGDDDDVRRHRRGPLTTIRIPRGFGEVDISLYRMPERPNAQSRFAQITTYSDGFSGKEREPIGRLMPVKQQSRRKESYNHRTIRYGELQLVQERPPEDPSEDPPEGPRRRKKKQRLRKKVPRSIPHQPEDDQMLMVDEEDSAQGAIIAQNKQSTEAVAQPYTPVIANQSLMSITPAGNTSPPKRKSQSMRLDPKANNQLESRAMTQRSVAEKPEEHLKLPPSTVPLLTKPKTERRRRNDQIASQEISLVTMKRTNKHGRREAEPELCDQVTAGHGDDDPDTRSEDASREVEANNTPSENEDGNGLDNVSQQSNPQSEPENSLERDYADDTEEKSNDFTSVPSDIVVDEDDQEGSARPPSSTHYQLCGNAIVQVHRQEIDILVAELNEQTKSEKARIREKLQAPPTSQQAKGKYQYETQGQEPRPSQQLPILASIASEALKLEHLSSQLSQHSANDLDGSWRPRIPETSGSEMQADEEIFDSPTPPHERERAASSRRQSLRRRPSIRSQSLYVVDQLPESGSSQIMPAITHDSQGGSIILGDTQNFRRSYPADIPETQFEEDEERNAGLHGP